MSKNQSQQIVLVGGAMRSGTTGIHRALCTSENSNPYISESWFLYDLFTLYKWNLTRYDVRNKDQFGDVNNFKTLIYNNIRNYFSIVSAKYNDPQVLFFKHPEITQHFSELSDEFSQMKFIVIVRDPRDVISSMMEVAKKHEKENIVSPQTRLRSVAEYCASYIRYYSVLKDAVKLKSRMILIKYEDFMADPKSSLERVTNLTGAKFDLSVASKFSANKTDSLNFDKELRLADPISAAFWSDLYTQSLSTERIGAHKKNLKKDQISIIEKTLINFGSSFGYWKKPVVKDNIQKTSVDSINKKS